MPHSTTRGVLWAWVFLGATTWCWMMPHHPLCEVVRASSQHPWFLVVCSVALVVQGIGAYRTRIRTIHLLPPSPLLPPGTMHCAVPPDVHILEVLATVHQPTYALGSW